MEKGLEKAMVQCPFFRKTDRTTSVTCEGVTDTSWLILRFRTREELRRQMEVFCCARYGCCEVYRAAAEKYE